jgi:hypothetical protein
MQIHANYLIVAILNKIIIYDVLTLKHLVKVDTVQDRAVFEAWVTSHDSFSHTLNLIYVDETKQSKINLDTCKLTLLSPCNITTSILT